MMMQSDARLGGVGQGTTSWLRWRASVWWTRPVGRQKTKEEVYHGW